MGAIMLATLPQAAWAQKTSAPAGAVQAVQPVPALMARVIDQTATLQPAERDALDARLAAFEREKGTQIVVLLVASTQPEDIAAYANRVANTWKIGRSAVGDGVLVIVAKDDRKLRIEVAKTLEGAVPDLAARQIMDEAMQPAFRAGNYAAGLNAAIDRLIARIKGESLPAPAAPAANSGEGEGGFQWFDLAIFLFFAVPIGAAALRSVLGRKLGALAVGTGAGALALFFTSSLLVAGAAGVIALLWGLFSSTALPTGRRGGGFGAGLGTGIGMGGMGGMGSGGWGGTSSGGFSSGGGGDFGGGGASGDW